MTQSTETPVKRNKLPSKYARFIVPLVLTFLMTFVVAGISTWRVAGGSDIFVAKWMVSWMISWAVAYPTMIVFMPIAQKLVFMIVEKPQPPKPKA